MSNRSYVQRPAAALLGERPVAALAETFKVLGDETRIRIIDALAGRRAAGAQGLKVRGAGAPGSGNELCVQDLASALGLTQSAVSHQLRLLRSMRLVRTRRDGRQIFYALDDDHIVKLFEQGLEHVEERMHAGGRASARRPTSAPESHQQRLRPHRAEDERIRGEVSASGRAGGGAPAPVKKRLRPHGAEDERIRGEVSASGRAEGGAPAPVKKRLRPHRAEDERIRGELAASGRAGGGAPAPTKKR